MSEIYKTHEEGLYFVSFGVVGWLDVFTRRVYQDILIDNIRYCQQNKGLLLYAYCIMPNHVHWIAARETGKLGHLLRDFKSYTAKILLHEVNNNHTESRRKLFLNQFRWYATRTAQEQEQQFWKHDNHAFELFTPEMTRQKMDYIHQNPVVAGFVDEDWKWRLSSANPHGPLKVLEI